MDNFFFVCGAGLLLALVAYIIIKMVATYNRLQLTSNRVREANSNILIMVQKKADLANQLINITGAYAHHEQLIHIAVAENMNVAAAMAVYQNINQTIQRVWAMAANFPDLQANQTFQQLMAQLQKIEDELQDKRERYNSVVREYNTTRNEFPLVLFAGMLNFREAPYFADMPEGAMQLRAANVTGQPINQLPVSPAQVLLPSPAFVGEGELIEIHGEAAGRSFPLVDGFLIGRGSGCQLQLADRAVSRQHARLRYANGRWYIQDLNSAGGIFVNGYRVNATALNPGDHIRVGSAEFEFKRNNPNS